MEHVWTILNRKTRLDALTLKFLAWFVPQNGENQNRLHGLMLNMTNLGKLHQLMYIYIYKLALIPSKCYNFPKPKAMWVKQCHEPPMTGNGKHRRNAHHLPHSLHGIGWGGVEWSGDVNVPSTLRKMLMHVDATLTWGGVARLCTRLWCCISAVGWDGAMITLIRPCARLWCCAQDDEIIMV